MSEELTNSLEQFWAGASEAAAKGVQVGQALKAANTSIYTPIPDSRLETLCAQYDLAKAERDKANEAFTTIADGIKAEIAAIAGDIQPGQNVDITSKFLVKALRYSTYEQISIKSAELRKEDPGTYAKYSTRKTIRRLAPVTS